MIQKFNFDGEDFKVMMRFENWKIGFLRYSERFSKFNQLERHTETDEAFVLLDGSAMLYTETEKIQMQRCTLYNIPKKKSKYINTKNFTFSIKRVTMY